jgi:hypothetical protein
MTESRTTGLYRRSEQGRARYTPATRAEILTHAVDILYEMGLFEKGAWLEGLTVAVEIQDTQRESFEREKTND